MASLVQSGRELNWIAVDQTRQVGLIMLSIPFLLQLTAAVFSYLARDGAAGAAVGVLSVSWLGQGLIDVTTTPASRSGALGLMLLGAGAVLTLSSIGVATTKPLPGAVFGLAAVRFLTAGIYQLDGSTTWQHAAGIIGLIVVAPAAYCVLAFELEGQHQRPALPTFRRGGTAGMADDDFHPTARNLATEAGVRRST